MNIADADDAAVSRLLFSLEYLLSGVWDNSKVYTFLFLKKNSQYIYWLLSIKHSKSKNLR